jgi:hypothetical protein
MQGLKDRIHSISEKYECFGYYELLIEKAERNAQVNPDICIEACKSLIEGISKQIQKSFNPQITEKDFKSRDISIQKIFGDTLNLLAEHNLNFEDNLMRQFCSAIKVIGEIRNTRGDISHGKIIPKAAHSDIALALFICQITEALVLYLLNVFETIDLSYLEDTKYDDCSDYNVSLDELFPLDGNVSYSKALYEQDYDEYVQGLENFKLEQEEYE